MKSELILRTKHNKQDFPKVMRNGAQTLVILATEQRGLNITGTAIWSIGKERIGNFHTDWNAADFIDLPQTECVVISNE